MRKLIESTFVSLDGVIDDTNPSTAPHAQPQRWGARYWDEEHFGYAQELLFSSDALLLGRVTFEGFVDSWPGRDGEFADRINEMPKYVASRTLQEPLDWNGRLIGSDLAAEVAKLKEEPGRNILKYGTGDLTRALMEHDLIDELHLWMFPVTLGAGKRLLEGIATTHLKVVDTTHFKSGIVVLKLEPK
jgi:dihydrofolate reductase